MTEILNYLVSLRVDGYMLGNIIAIFGVLYVFSEKVDWKSFNQQLEHWLSYKKEKKELEEKFNKLLKTKSDEIEAQLKKKYLGLKKDEDELVVSIREKEGHLSRIKAAIGPLEEKTAALKKQQEDVVREGMSKLNGEREARSQKEAELLKKELALRAKEQELAELDVKIAENTGLVNRLDALCTFISGATNIKVKDLVLMFKRATKQQHQN